MQMVSKTCWTYREETYQATERSRWEMTSEYIVNMSTLMIITIIVLF